MSIADEISKKLKKCQDEVINQVTNKSMAGSLIEQIKKRTRAGYEVINGKIVKMPSLKESTKENRRRYSSNLSKYTKPSFSNVTATGQLLKSMDSVATKDSIKLYLRDNRVSDLSGGAPRIQNNELNRHLEEGSKNREPRTFFNLADFEIKQFERIIANKLRNCIRRNLT